MTKKTAPPGLNKDLARTFQRLSNRAASMLRELEQINPKRLRLTCDRWAHGSVSCDLIWAAENLHVIASHLRGEKLHDGMGAWHSYESVEQTSLKGGSRVLAKGETILEANEAEFRGKKRSRYLPPGTATTTRRRSKPKSSPRSSPKN